MNESYLTVTELPGKNASKDQLGRLYHRYHFASTYCPGKNVLEVACGAGMGLGYLAKVSKRVVGCDIDAQILKYAHATYRNRKHIEITKADAQQLPFKKNTFDVIILYEAIYYLPEPKKFLSEAKRTLRDKGVLIVCTVNKEWIDFNPSPFTNKYFSSSELFESLSKDFSKVEIYGAFLTTPNSLKDKTTSFIKRVAVSFHLMPKTMKGKELLKRIFFGKLSPLPKEIEAGVAEYSDPEPISHDCPNPQYKVLYGVAFV